MNCFSCNLEIQVKDKVFFRDRCPDCDTALHVCLNCLHYDPAAYNGCRESSAERVVEKKRENRCEYFKPGSKKQTISKDKNKDFNDLFNV